MQYTIRPTREDDIPQLIIVERAANAASDQLGFVNVEHVMSEEIHRVHQQDGRSWVAVDEQDQPLGFAVACEVSGHGHLEELDVHPDYWRRGIGRTLIITVCEWASARGYSALTLTTERDVPWNAPFYAKLGFEIVPPEEWTGAQRHVFETDAAVSNSQNRVLMRRKLTSGTESA